jgi:hypothetical protein
MPVDLREAKHGTCSATGPNGRRTLAAPKPAPRTPADPWQPCVCAGRRGFGGRKGSSGSVGAGQVIGAQTNRYSPFVQNCPHVTGTSRAFPRSFLRCGRSLQYGGCLSGERGGLSSLRRRVFRAGDDHGRPQVRAVLMHMAQVWLRLADQKDDVGNMSKAAE